MKRKNKLNQLYSTNPEGTLAIATSLLLLLTAMIDPIFSAGLSIGIIVSYGIYKFVIKNKT